MKFDASVVYYILLYVTGWIFQSLDSVKGGQISGGGKTQSCAGRQEFPNHVMLKDKQVLCQPTPDDAVCVGQPHFSCYNIKIRDSSGEDYLLHTTDPRYDTEYWALCEDMLALIGHETNLVSAVGYSDTLGRWQYQAENGWRNRQNLTTIQKNSFNHVACAYTV